MMSNIHCGDTVKIKDSNKIELEISSPMFFTDSDGIQQSVVQSLGSDTLYHVRGQGGDRPAMPGGQAGASMGTTGGAHDVIVHYKSINKWGCICGVSKNAPIYKVSNIDVFHSDNEEMFIISEADEGGNHFFWIDKTGLKKANSAGGGIKKTKRRSKKKRQSKKKRKSKKRKSKTRRKSR